MIGESAGATQSHQKTWGSHQKSHHNNVCHMSSSCEVKWTLLPECTCSTRPLTAPKGVGWMTIRSSRPTRSFMGAGGPDAGYLARNGGYRDPTSQRQPSSIILDLCPALRHSRREAALQHPRSPGSARPQPNRSGPPHSVRSYCARTQ